MVDTRSLQTVGMDSTVACPICTMTDILTTADGGHECVTCGHEWDGDASDPTALGEIRDSNGTVLQNGDSVVVIEQLLRPCTRT